MDQAVALEGAALAAMHIVQHLAFGNAQRARVSVREDALRVLGKEVRKPRLANVRVARIDAQQMDAGRARFSSARHSRAITQCRSLRSRGGTSVCVKWSSGGSVHIERGRPSIRMLSGI